MHLCRATSLGVAQCYCGVAYVYHRVQFAFSVTMTTSHHILNRIIPQLSRNFHSLIRNRI